MPLRLICITRTTCRWGTELMLWMLGKPVLDQLKLSGSFRVTTCTQTSRPQGEIMLTMKNTKLAFTVQQTFWCMTVSATLFSKISKSFVVVRFVTETLVAAHQHLSNGCWDCFSNFWAWDAFGGKVVRIVFGKSVGDVTHESVAQAKEIDRKITAIFTLCLTEVANWLPNASIPPPFKTKERQLLVVEAPLTLWLQTDC